MVRGQPCSLWAPQRRCSFLSGSELRDKSCVNLFLLLPYCSCWLWSCFVPIYSLELFLCTRSLAWYSRTQWWTFDSNNFFSFILYFESRFTSFVLPEVSSQCRKFWAIETSYIGSEVPIGLTCVNIFFLSLQVHLFTPPLGITKMLSGGEKVM